MILGISTKVMRDYSFGKTLDILHDIGYKAVELWVDDLLHADISNAEIIKRLEQYGMHKSVHLLTEDLNIASFNEGIRKESLHQQKEGIKRAAEIGAREVTLHPGRKTAKTRTLEEAWEIQLESIAELTQTAKQEKVILCVEGMEKFSGEFVQTIADLKRILDYCNNPKLAATLDIAHLQTIGNPKQMILEAKCLNIGNVHISQATKEKPHFPVFFEKGEVNFMDVFRELKRVYDGALIIEGYVAGQGIYIAEESMKWYRNIMEEING